MADFAKILAQGAMQTQQNMGANLQSGAKLGQAFKQHKVEQQKLQAAEKRHELEQMKMINTDLVNFYTKVPERAKNAHLKNYLKPRFEQLGMPLSEPFMAALQSPDVDHEAIVENLNTTLFEINKSIDTGQPMSADGLEAQAFLFEAIGDGDATKFAPFIRKATATAVTVKAQRMRLKSQEQRHREEQARKTKENFEARKDKLLKFADKKGLQGLQTTFEGLDEMIPGGIDGWDGQNVPGIGGLEEKLTSGLMNKKAARTRQLALGLANQVLKARSGGAVTPEEAVRVIGELGFQLAPGEGGGIISTFMPPKSDADFVNGVRDAISTVRKLESDMRNTYGEDAYEAVFKRAPRPARQAPAKQEQKAAPVVERKNLTPTQQKAFDLMNNNPALKTVRKLTKSQVRKMNEKQRKEIRKALGLSSFSEMMKLFPEDK